MFRRTGSPLLLALLVSTAAACGSDAVPPLAGDKLSGFSVGQVGDSTPSTPSTPTGNEAMQVGGIIKGLGLGADTMATAPILAGVEVKAFKHLGYSGNDVLIGEQVGSSLTTDANGWFGYLSLLPGKYVVTFTPSTNSAFRAIYVTYESRGSSPGTTVTSVWGIFLPRK